MLSMPKRFLMYLLCLFACNSVFALEPPQYEVISGIEFGQSEEGIIFYNLSNKNHVVGTTNGVDGMFTWRDENKNKNVDDNEIRHLPDFYDRFQYYNSLENMDVNDHGHIMYTYNVMFDVVHGSTFVDVGNGIKDEYEFLFGYALSNSGFIAGNLQSMLHTNIVAHAGAFLMGKLQRIPPLCDPIDIEDTGTTYDVNDSGLFVGWSSTSAFKFGGETCYGPKTSFMAKDHNGDGDFTDDEVCNLGIPDTANAVNDWGMIAGTNRSRGFLFVDTNQNFAADEGETIYLDNQKDEWRTFVHDINNNGWIVGREQEKDKEELHSFASVWIEGEVYDLNDYVPDKWKGKLHQAKIINDNSWIIAGKCKKYSKTTPYLLIPKNKSDIPMNESLQHR